MRIENSRVEAIRAVNKPLASDARVGLVTEGEFAGDYVVSASDFESVEQMGIGLEYNDGADLMYDALTTVTYPEESIATATYAGEGDNLVYACGGNFITAVPEGAKVIMKTTGDDPIEDFKL